MKIDLYVSGDMKAAKLRGGEKHAMALATEFQKLGHEVAIVCRGDGDTCQRYKSRDIEIRRLAAVEPRRFFWRFGPRANIAPLGEAIKREISKADIAFCFSPWLTLACLKADAAKQTVQIVADVLSASEAYEKGRRFNFSSLSWLLAGPSAIAERSSFRLSNASIVSSDVIKSGLVKSGIPASKLHTVYPAGMIDISKTDQPIGTWRNHYNIPSAAMVVLSCGALTRRKNPTALLKAIAKQNSDVYAITAGDGPLMNDLKALTNSLGIDDRVRFTGWLEDMRPCYLAADVLCHCASYETYGLVYVEAMSCNLALLGPANDPPQCWSSAGEIFRPGIDGLLFDSRSGGDLAKCIRHLSEDRHLLATLKQGASERAEFFNWRDYARQALDIANNLP